MVVLNGTDCTIEKRDSDYSFSWYSSYLIHRGQDDIIEKLTEWLSNNCIANFVISENRESRLAGGYTDNKSAFENGLQNYKENRLTRLLHLRHIINLGSKEDDIAFQLTWIDYTKE